MTSEAREAMDLRTLLDVLHAFTNAATTYRIGYVAALQPMPEDQREAFCTRAARRANQLLEKRKATPSP